MFPPSSLFVPQTNSWEMPAIPENQYNIILLQVASVLSKAFDQHTLNYVTTTFILQKSNNDNKSELYYKSTLTRTLLEQMHYLFMAPYLTLSIQRHLTANHTTNFVLTKMRLYSICTAFSLYAATDQKKKEMHGSLLILPTVALLPSSFH